MSVFLLLTPRHQMALMAGTTMSGTQLGDSVVSGEHLSLDDESGFIARSPPCSLNSRLDPLLRAASCHTESCLQRPSLRPSELPHLQRTKVRLLRTFQWCLAGVRAAPIGSCASPLTVFSLLVLLNISTCL
eukprot:752311-Hanusia_phi.AAC.2